MYNYCGFQQMNLYKYTKSYCYGRMHKYALLKNKSFRCIEYSKQILQNSIFFSLLSVINFTS